MKWIKHITGFFLSFFFFFFWDPQKSQNRDVLGSSRGARYWFGELSQIWANGEGVHELRDDWMEWIALAVPLDPAAKIVEPLPTKLNRRNVAYCGHIQIHKTIVAVGSDRKLSHLVSNCESQRLSFPVSWSDLRVNNKGCHIEDSLSLWTVT